jgi:hypothetical protein
MPILQLTLIAIITMAGLAALRLVRVRSGRTPLPEGRSRLLLLAAFVFVPPLAIAALALAPGTSQVSAVISVGTYLAILAGVVLAMSTVAEVIGGLFNSQLAQVVRLALAGTDLDPDDIPRNVPLTARLTEILAIVRAADAAFPSGPGFPHESERPGFRSAWDALDRATKTLEEQMAADRKLGFGVAASAQTMAEDVRSRLSVLRRFASRNGQAWAQS